MKKSRYFLGFLSLVAILIWAAFFTWPSKNFSVSFFDVGQGDAIFVQSPSGYQMLIDGGPSNKVLEELGKEMPFWDREIDLLVLSHPHADHLTGLIEVLERYDVGQILATDAVHTSPEFLEWLNLIKEKNILFEVSYQVSAIDLGDGVKAQILYPKQSYKDKNVSDLNETSLVLRLEYVNVSFLFTGDLEKDNQQKLLSTLSTTSMFLKVPHHGSKNALDSGFLEIVKPKVAIISVGKNSYGHPARETIEKLEGMKVEVKRTDKDGSVKVEVEKDGKWKIK